MQLAHFRHKGLRRLYEDGKAKGVPDAMADKLGKLLFALETAEDLDQARRFPGWNLHPLKADLKGFCKPHRHGKLASDLPLRRTKQHRDGH
jgi:proteic killer suppression protein